MTNSSPHVEILTIERLGAQGDGVAPGPLFVAGVLPGERVRVRVAGERGQLEEILSPSPDRVAPPCPHFGDCGGCALQHWAAEPYLAWKVEQIRLALGRERIETELLAPFAAPPGSRRRLALHARRKGQGAEIGFKARRSWRLAPIDTCVVAEPALVRVFPALRRLAAPLFEHPKSAPILHVTSSETGIDVDITGVERRAGSLSADARMALARVAAEADFARVTLNGETIAQLRPPRLRIGGVSLDLPPGSFLQAVPAAEAAMGAFTVEAVDGAAAVADLYCGVGAFALRLARQARVLAVDVSAEAVRALAAAHGGAEGLKPIAVEARDLARRPLLARDLATFEAAVIDPPRAGAPEQHRELAASQVSRIVGVSCNPATFVRDARILTDAGFKLERVLPVDQFLWSPHIELVGVFSR